jgi:hypothetical protein
VPVTVLMAESMVITLPMVTGLPASQWLSISRLIAGAEKG